MHRRVTLIDPNFEAFQSEIFRCMMDMSKGEPRLPSGSKLKFIDSKGEAIISDKLDLWVDGNIVYIQFSHFTVK